MDKKRQLIFIVFVLLFSLVVQSPVGMVAEEENLLDISGDELIIDTTTQRIEFLGHAVAFYQEFELTGDQIIYQQSDGWVELKGNVQLTGKDLTATAGLIRIDLDQNLITFQENAQVNWQGQLIRGSVITYNLQTGILKAQKGHVRIHKLDE